MSKWIVVGVVAVMAGIGVGFALIKKDTPKETQVAPQPKSISKDTNIAPPPKPISKITNDELRKTVVLNCEDIGPGTAKILCEMERMQ